MKLGIIILPHILSESYVFYLPSPKKPNRIKVYEIKNKIDGNILRKFLSKSTSNLYFGYTEWFNKHLSGNMQLIDRIIYFSDERYRKFK